jgi:hypothetical protein
MAGVIFPSTSTNDVVFGGDSTASARIGFLNLAGGGTPTLYVKGNLFLNSTSGQNYLDLATNSRFNIRTINSDNSATERFTILPNGNIGIGTINPTEKLEVEGNVKVNGSLQLTPIDAATAGPCDAANEGKIYYDYNQTKLFTCQADSTHTTFTWTPLN